MCCKTSEVAKLISREWKQQPPEERFKWDEIARKDKERWLRERETYTGPWKVATIPKPNSKRKRRDPTAPKRPASAFLLFSNFKRADVKDEHLSRGVHLNNAGASKILGKIWKELPQHEKQTFIDQEAKLRSKYKLDMIEWKKKNDVEEEEQRRPQKPVKRVIEDRLDVSSKRQGGDLGINRDLDDAFDEKIWSIGMHDDETNSKYEGDFDRDHWPAFSGIDDAFGEIPGTTSSSADIKEDPGLEEHDFFKPSSLNSLDSKQSGHSSGIINDMQGSLFSSPDHQSNTNDIKPPPLNASSSNRLSRRGRAPSRPVAAAQAPSHQHHIQTFQSIQNVQDQQNQQRYHNAPHAMNIFRSTQQKQPNNFGTNRNDNSMGYNQQLYYDQNMYHHPHHEINRFPPNTNMGQHSLYNNNLPKDQPPNPAGRTVSSSKDFDSWDRNRSPRGMPDQAQSNNNAYASIPSNAYNNMNSNQYYDVYDDGSLTPIPFLPVNDK